MKASANTPVDCRTSLSIPMRVLGIKAGEINHETAEQFGLEVGKGIIVTGLLGSYLKSPAAIAGIKVGDIICEINGLSVTSPLAVKNYLSSHTIDAPIGILLRHKDIWRFLTVRLDHSRLARRRLLPSRGNKALHSPSL